jgi:hypothetical protein
MKSRSALLACLVFSACSQAADEAAVETVHDGPPIVSINPAVLVPSSLIVIGGNSFVPSESGSSRLRLRGTFAGLPFDLVLDARFVDYDRMHVSWPGAAALDLAIDEGSFEGQASIEVDSKIDGRTHTSPPVAVSLSVRKALDPRLNHVQDGVIFVNDPIPVDGDGFLLGGEEGSTYVVVEGCYAKQGATSCDPVGPAEVRATPASPFDRTRATFPFAPAIAGIQPGRFEGVVLLRNDHSKAAGSAVREGGSRSVAFEIQRPTLFSISPSGASLGQFVFIRGGGFVETIDRSAAAAVASTELEFLGAFRPDGASADTPVALTLLPEVVSGQQARYVLNEEDQLGTSIDLRVVSGTFTGKVRPKVRFGKESLQGDPMPATLRVERVKQIVYVRFVPSYVESLRHFGLRVVDQAIRDRVLQVARRDYAGVNVEVRTQPPEDFALFETVEVSGPDPNGLGLLGYDNTPGKDTDNARLYDKIGGVNASTQEDGYPGYGGVFVESFFGFSTVPGVFAKKLDGASAVFEQLFDPFRPDRGGKPVRAEDVAAGIATIDSGAECPAAAADRPRAIACAVWALGSMIGTTMTHEIGHSLGLADPYGSSFHNPGDLPNRLMDAGGARTFLERTELGGEGPAVFCQEEFEYLRKILPLADPPPLVSRPSCY